MAHWVHKAEKEIEDGGSFRQRDGPVRCEVSRYRKSFCAAFQIELMDSKEDPICGPKQNIYICCRNYG